jgi:hypothetical protein
MITTSKFSSFPEWLYSLVKERESLIYTMKIIEEIKKNNKCYSQFDHSFAFFYLPSPKNEFFSL